MKKICIALFVLAMLVPTCYGMSFMYHYDHYRRGFMYAMEHLSNKTKMFLMDMLNSTTKKLSSEHTGNLFTYVTLPGVYKKLELTIYGFGSMNGSRKDISYSVVNKQNIKLDLQYYPRNVTMYVYGYEWWNSTNQKLVNNTDKFLAGIEQNNGYFSFGDTYATVKPVWQSKGSDIVVNTTGQFLQWSSDTVAGKQSIIYNITLTNGTFTSMTWSNTSCYVAPNTTAGTGQDDLAIYYSTDGGSTWNTIFTAADGATSTGIQWTGTHTLTVSGKKSVLINITFISDGANDNTASPDIYLKSFEISGYVSKLPTVKPSVMINGKTYSSSETLTNGSYVKFYLGNNGLNLTNDLKISCEGSQKAIVKLYWNNDNRTCIKMVQMYNKVYNVHKFLADGQKYTFNFTDVKTHGIIPLWITIDDHTTMNKFKYEINATVYKWQCAMGSKFVADPSNGVIFSENATIGKVIPMFIKPTLYPVTCNVTWFNPNASDINSTVINMTAGSTHGNIVNFVIGNITYAKKLSLYVDGKLRKIVPVYNDTCYFNWSNWSDHTITLKVYETAGAIAAPSGKKLSLMDIAIFIAVLLVLSTIVVMVYNIYRGKRY